MMNRDIIPGLDSLCNAYNALSEKKISPFEIAYYIRQINISNGCSNNCLHCFADAPLPTEQMKIESFEKLAKEIGYIAHSFNKPYDFLFLGSSTDPSSIQEYHKYFEIWINTLPKWHSNHFYTHGWLLHESNQLNEFKSLCIVLRRNVERVTRINFSFDLFNQFARDNLNEYLENLSRNIKELIKIVPIEALRLHVMYPISRLDILNDKFMIGYWRKLASSSEIFPEKSRILHELNYAESAEEKECTFLTKAIFSLADKIGVTYRQISTIARDGGVPIPSGRALKMYENRCSIDKENVLSRYQKFDLKSLENFIGGFKGIIIMPDGTAQSIDYLGYKLGEMLNNGNKVIPYINSFPKKIEIN